MRKSDAVTLGGYRYDALGRRVGKVAQPTGTPIETTYYHDGDRVIEQRDTLGGPATTYVHGHDIDDVLTLDRGAAAFYFHQNHLGSVAALTDATGNIVERYVYDGYGAPTIRDAAGLPVPANPWGTPHSAVANPHLFTGRELDEETGLHFFRARYYDARLGRFLQRDPLEYVDGMNLYEYVRSGPATGTDPLGLTLKIGTDSLTEENKAKNAVYKRLSANPFHKQVLDKMIESKYPYEASAEALEQELKMREAFVACMRKHAPAGGGCKYGKEGEAFPSTKAAGWKGTTYQGADPSAALNAFEEGPSVMDCYSMGNFCMWIALRDALGEKDFNDRFKNKRIKITAAMKDNYPGVRGAVDMTPITDAKKGMDILPGDFVQFHNAPKFAGTRKEGANRNYSSENAAYEGIVGKEGKYCGFGITSKTAADMHQALLNEYNKGAIDGTEKKTPDNTKINIGNIRRPNPGYTLP